MYETGDSEEYFEYLFRLNLQALEDVEDLLDHFIYTIGPSWENWKVCDTILGVPESYWVDSVDIHLS